MFCWFKLLCLAQLRLCIHEYQWSSLPYKKRAQYSSHDSARVGTSWIRASNLARKCHSQLIWVSSFSMWAESELAPACLWLAHLQHYDSNSRWHQRGEAIGPTKLEPMMAAIQVRTIDLLSKSTSSATTHQQIWPTGWRRTVAATHA
jgi:hypothetical protein